MAATEAVGESQLQRIIRDLRDAVAELTKEYRETGEPITDDSPNLHRFSYKLEYLLQFDQKEKVSFLGARKDYWDYFTDCLAKVKGANDGIRFVRSILELKTSLGKGRAFIRYSLVHQRLADTLQQCLMNQRVTSDWYYTRSPLLKPQQSFDIIGHLYELNDVQFDVASRGHDLDSTWPTFARRTLGGSPTHLWKPPSRSSSINSLVSAYSQVQDFPSSPDLATAEAACDFVTPCAVDELRLELDQSELRQHELLGRVGELGQEAVELRAVLEELQGQLDASLAAQEAGRLELEALRAAKGSWEAAEQQLRVRLAEAEQKNTELLARLDSVVDEKSQQAATHFDSAQKIHSLLDELNKAEKARLEASQEAEIQKREAQRLVEELRLSETVLAEERAKADRLQGVLAVNEKASRSLERQLEDLKHSLETTVCEAEEERRKAQEEKGELQQRIDSQRVLLENQIRTLTQRLKAKDEEVSAGLMTVNHLEEQVTKLAAEKQGLEGGVAELQASMKDQTRQTEDYKTQCTSLMEINGKLLQTVKKNEETKSELTEARVAKESELAALRTLEKQLRSQIDDAAVALGEHERLLREENQRLDEGLRRAIVEKETTEGVVRELEQEIQELKEELAATEGVLSSSREELRTTGGRVTDLEGSLAASRESEAALCKKLQEMANLLEVQSHQYQELEARVKELQEEKQDVTSALMVAEGQVELNAKEVSRLQAELLDVRAELQAAVEEKRRTQASREELATLLEEMKGLEKELRSQQAEKEVELMDVTDRETQVQAKLVFAKEELSALKALHESLVLEQAEAREGLHRANTETAELGITVCRLTSENHEAVRKLEEAAREAESLSASLAALQQENASLQEELRQSQGLARTTMELKGQLEQARSLQEASCEEVEALKFQMSSKAINQQNQLKVIRDEAKKVGEQLAAEKEKVSLLEARLSLLEAASGDFTQLIEEKNAQISRSEAAVQQAEEELQQLREELLRTQEDLFTARTGCEDLRADLDRASEERRNLEMKTQAEIEDLCKTKSNLEERLIELIRDKDALWQKTDALEFEQKLRAGEQWWLVDKEANRCLGCRSPFTWWLRRHHCRLCGRIFCYYCSNNVAVTKHGGKKERCCRECYSQHCAVVERLTQAEVSNNQDASTAPCPPSAPGPAPYTPMPRVAVTDPNTQLDDATFDIITTEDLDGIYDSDSLSQQMAGADVSTGEATPEEIDGLMPDCQDVEIHLLESGELTSVVPLKVEEVSRFGEGPRELFVRSSCYSVVSITVPESGYTISWVFSSEPRSVSFSVVYREASDSPLEQTRVLIPLTRCNSHQENIHGQLKAQRPGVYTLVFDNSYSRFISKTVVYHLTVEKPVIYDGSDS